MKENHCEEDRSLIGKKVKLSDTVGNIQACLLIGEMLIGIIGVVQLIPLEEGKDETLCVVTDKHIIKFNDFPSWEVVL